MYKPSHCKTNVDGSMFPREFLPRMWMESNETMNGVM